MAIRGHARSTLRDTGAGWDASYQLIKRIFDVIVALIATTLLVPVLVVIGLIILLDSGWPIILRQERIGCRGSTFRMLKFRTMREERRRRGVGPPAGIGERRRRHKSARDPRVTRVGHLLRRTSLDELPQLFNVLSGAMSLVGPRPELPEIVARYEPWQHARHLVRPGITGWWQINRDAERLMHEATEFDLHYIEHRSLRLDLVILLRTAATVVHGRGAF